jgi:uncharacterized protein YbjQ (UPF0145 family)
VATFVGVDAPAFGKTNYSGAFATALNQLAQEAQKIQGANGVIWISFSPQWLSQASFYVFASGTAVRVIEEKA